MSTLALFRVRVVLEATADVRLHAVHSPALYALLAAAYGRGCAAAPALPDGLMLDAPEQCRVLVRRGEPYAFGFTLLAPTPTAATDTAVSLLRGLRSLGESAASHRPVWGGNFRVTAAEDLIAGSPWTEPAPLAPLPDSHLFAEIGRLLGSPRLTLRFTTPFRAERSNAAKRTTGGGFFDRTHFPPHGFLTRLWNRLAGLGFVSGDHPPTAGVSIADNHLVWLDFSYGFAAARKRMGGAVGELTLDGVPAEWLRPLVLGQYARCGLNTRFGFGAYRLTALGPEPFACRRAVGLLELALRPHTLASAAETEDLPPGRLMHLAELLRTGAYQPATPTAFSIPKANGTSRQLSVPKREDRALQRAVHTVLAVGLDPLLEDSSLAFRKGFGRHRAARAVRELWADGYRWAVRADVHQFFDSIRHDELRRRLSAYLNDDPAVERVMGWVTAHAPAAGVGLPTGSPLSPLLGNLFLDGFDEAVAADGGRLVRYADDFLILTHTRDEAERMQAVAEHAAADLALTLNADKSGLQELRSPFTFVGFRFERKEKWETRAVGEVRAVEELGWADARPGPGFTPAFRFVGETASAADDGETLIAGPGVFPVRLVGDAIACGDGEHTDTRAVSGLDSVILIGSPTVHADALRALADSGVPTFLVDDRLRHAVTLVGEFTPEEPTAVAAQLRLLADEPLRLTLARPLVAAKLRNYAALADGTARKPDDTGRALRELAARAEAAAGFDELLGYEGAGGRRWYSSLPSRLPAGWHFPGRTAPAADDPVNVLLNIAHTLLHRWAILAARTAGLIPTVGFLHRPRSGHAALASDLQEPFRHLMDRAVLEVLVQLKPADFRKTPAGRFPLTILPHASQLATAEFTRALRRGVPTATDSEPKSFRRHLLALARTLRRHLTDPTHPFTVFTHTP